jgi:hypothetical protein
MKSEADCVAATPAFETLLNTVCIHGLGLRAELAAARGRLDVR